MITRILQLSGRVASNAWVEIGVGADADILVADRGGKREERATFGRRAPGQQRSINTQEPEWLGRVDLAIWETQRCLIPLCGFVCAASADGATSATWLSQDGGALYAAGLRNVMDIGGRLQMGFSLLVASSTSLPTQRPLCVAGDATHWLQVSGEEAMRHLMPWRLERCTTAAGVRPEWASEAHATHTAPVWAARARADTRRPVGASFLFSRSVTPCARVGVLYRTTSVLHGRRR